MNNELELIYDNSDLSPFFFGMLPPAAMILFAGLCRNEEWPPRSNVRNEIAFCLLNHDLNTYLHSLHDF